MYYKTIGRYGNKELDKNFVKKYTTSLEQLKKKTQTEQH